MPKPLGANNAQLAHVRELLAKKGRREHGRFLFEGPTLLEEAGRSGAPIDAIYATQAAYDRFKVVRDLDAGGVEVFVVEERTLKKLSDVQTPSGIVAVAPVRLEDLAMLLSEPGIVLALADVGDPGNAGTLIRSADAFGARGVIFGTEAVEPHNPKVVRSAMGSLFRTRICVAGPAELAAAALAAGWPIAGLEAGGDPLAAAGFPSRLVLVVGGERQGLGRWAPICSRTLSIAMSGSAESLNAAVAGSIALYESMRRSA